MRVFGRKQMEPTDEDRLAAARLSSVANRFKVGAENDLTEISPDPIGEPDEADEPEDAEQPEDAEEPETEE